MSIRAAPGLLCSCLALAACTGDETSTARTVPPPEQTKTSPSDVSTLLAADEWRDVIDDWYDDGTFDRPHRCVAVREAMERLPTSPPDYSTVYADMSRYANRVCG